MALFSALLIVVVAICLASITVCALAVSIGGSRVTDIDQYCESYYSMHNQNERYSNLTYVKKTQLKNGTNATFVFIAGLGGTGHHLFAQVMDSISKNQSINKNHYDASMIRLQLWNSKSHGLFTFNDVTNLCSSMNSVVRGYHYYMQHATRKSYYMLNGLSQNERTGFLSYPNRYPDDLPYEPDLNVLAALAEMSHADLRILVLLRHPVNSVISILKSYYGSNKKSHNSIEHYVDVFAKSQHYLLLQLIATDPAFYVCVEYEHILEQVSRVEKMIFKNMNGMKFTKTLQKVYKPTHLNTTMEIDIARKDEPFKPDLKINTPTSITYGQLAAIIEEKMMEDYASLKQLCKLNY